MKNAKPEPTGLESEIAADKPNRLIAPQSLIRLCRARSCFVRNSGDNVLEHIMDEFASKFRELVRFNVIKSRLQHAWTWRSSAPFRQKLAVDISIADLSDYSPGIKSPMNIRKRSASLELSRGNSP